MIRGRYFFWASYSYHIEEHNRLYWAWNGFLQITIDYRSVDNIDFRNSALEYTQAPYLYVSDVITIAATYLDGGFWQVKGCSQFTSSGPGHVVLPVELFLQTCYLLPGKSCSVSAHLVRRTGQGALRSTTCLWWITSIHRTATHGLRALTCTQESSTGHYVTVMATPLSVYLAP